MRSATPAARGEAERLGARPRRRCRGGSSRVKACDARAGHRGDRRGAGIGAGRGLGDDGEAARGRARAPRCGCASRRRRAVDAGASDRSVAASCRGPQRAAGAPRRAAMRRRRATATHLDARVCSLHLRVERQQDRVVARGLGARQRRVRGRSAWAASRWMHMMPRRVATPAVEHGLHDAALVDAGGRAGRSSSASSSAPRRARPARVTPSSAGEQLGVAVGERAAAGDDPGQALELLAADRGLDVGHPVVEALAPGSPRRSPSRLPWRSVSGTLMPCWRQRRNRASQLGVRGRQHPAVAGGDAPCAGGTRSRRCRRAAGRSVLQAPSRRISRADGAGGVLDHRQAVARARPAGSRARSQGMPIWWTHEDRPRPRRDRAPRSPPGRC